MAFRSRIYNGLGDFLYDFLRFIINSFAYIRNASNRRVEQALREKLMVAVSGVLECKYCTWLHSEMALTHGVDEAEIQKLLSSELGDFPEDESV
ncbi:MAG: carboxymuconolactone decarboxylase family protein, partial [Deltaproteobacteria bacterium]